MPDLQEGAKAPSLLDWVLGALEPIVVSCCNTRVICVDAANTDVNFHMLLRPGSCIDKQCIAIDHPQNLGFHRPYNFIPPERISHEDRKTKIAIVFDKKGINSKSS